MWVVLNAALAYAAQAHAPDDLAHPLGVMENLKRVGHVTDERLLCVAILHDTIEWGTGNLEEINTEFGPEVASLVSELTRTEPDIARLSKAEASALRQEFLLKDVTAMSRPAMEVKLADRLTNLEGRIATCQVRERYRIKTRAILGIIPRTINPFLWDAIHELVENP